MRERKKFKAYLYTCEAHSVGEFIRVVDANDRLGLSHLSVTVAHADHCWIQGCQHQVSQVRLVEVQKTE